VVERRQQNLAFRQSHNISESTGAHLYTQYVPSQHNPAGAPSRGILGPPSRVLPPIPIADAIQPYT
jgi:hypothetical protein